MARNSYATQLTLHGDSNLPKTGGELKGLDFLNGTDQKIGFGLGVALFLVIGAVLVYFFFCRKTKPKCLNDDDSYSEDTGSHSEKEGFLNGEDRTQTFIIVDDKVFDEIELDEPGSSDLTGTWLATIHENIDEIRLSIRSSIVSVEEEPHCSTIEVLEQESVQLKQPLFTDENLQCQTQTNEEHSYESVELQCPILEGSETPSTSKKENPYQEYSMPIYSTLVFPLKESVNTQEQAATDSSRPFPMKRAPEESTIYAEVVFPRKEVEPTHNLLSEDLKKKEKVEEAGISSQRDLKSENKPEKIQSISEAEANGEETSSKNEQPTEKDEKGEAIAEISTSTTAQIEQANPTVKRKNSILAIVAAVKKRRPPVPKPRKFAPKVSYDPSIERKVSIRRLLSVKSKSMRRTTSIEGKYTPKEHSEL